MYRRYKDPIRRAKAMRKAREETERKNKEYEIMYSKKFPERRKANNLVNSAVSSGKLPPAKDRICEECGKMATLYHHKDYSKPLDVTPLCSKCHALTQSKIF